MYHLWLFGYYKELSSWDRDHVAHKANNIYNWPFTGKVCQPLACSKLTEILLNPLDSGKFYFNKGLYYKVILVVCMSPILFFTTNISCSQMSKARFKDFLFLQEYKTQSSSTIATVNSTSSHNSFSLIPYWAFGSDVSP